MGSSRDDARIASSVRLVSSFTNFLYKNLRHELAASAEFFMVHFFPPTRRLAYGGSKICGATPDPAAPATRYWRFGQQLAALYTRYVRRQNLQEVSHLMNRTRTTRRKLHTTSVPTATPRWVLRTADRASNSLQLSQRRTFCPSDTPRRIDDERQGTEIFEARNIFCPQPTRRTCLSPMTRAVHAQRTTPGRYSKRMTTRRSAPLIDGGDDGRSAYPMPMANHQAHSYTWMQGVGFTP